MPRMKSEMFEEYAKIADKVGLTKMAEDSAELKKYKDDAEARVGSDDISTIEALYGVKPEGQDYDWNIMEQAHPNSVVIAPSYDKMNGLVENNIEQHNIMSNIALKPNTGNHTNPKYAQQELVMELVRVANEMDARNKEELFKLADSCLIDLSACQRQPQVKTALAPLAIAGIVAAAAVLGAGWLASHTDNVDHGPLANANEAIAALQKLQTNSWYESDVDETVQQEADNLIKHIEQLKNAIVKFNQVNDVIYKPRTLSETKELIKLKNVAVEHGDTVAASVNEFKKNVMELEPLLNQAIENFSDEYYQKQHTKPSMIGKMTGWLGEALHGRWGLIANDFLSAVNALNPLKESLADLTKKVSSFDKVVSKYEQDVKAAYAKFNIAAPGTEESATVVPTRNPMPEASKDYSDMISQITGKEPTNNEIEFLKHLMDGS